MTRAEATPEAARERQAPRDAVIRQGAEDLAELERRPKLIRPPNLTKREEAALTDLILRGSNVKRSGISIYTRKDIALLIEHCPTQGI